MLKQDNCSPHPTELVLNDVPQLFILSEHNVVAVFIFFGRPFHHFAFNRQGPGSKELWVGNIVGCNYTCRVYIFIDEVAGEPGVVEGLATQRGEKCCSFRHAWSSANPVVCTSSLQEFLVVSHSSPIQALLVPPTVAGGTNASCKFFPRSSFRRRDECQGSACWGGSATCTLLASSTDFGSNWRLAVLSSCS